MESDNTKAEYITYENVQKWAIDNIKTQYVALPPAANMSFRSLTQEESIKTLPREIKVSTSSLLLGHRKYNKINDKDSKVYAHVCGKHLADVKFSCGKKPFTQASLGGITLLEPFCNLVGSISHSHGARNLKVLVIFYFLASGHLEKYVQAVPYLPEFKTACTAAWKGIKVKNTISISLDKGGSTGFGGCQDGSDDSEEGIETELVGTTPSNRKIQNEPSRGSQGKRIVFDNGVAIGFVEQSPSSTNLDKGVQIQSSTVSKGVSLKRKRQNVSIIDHNRSSSPELIQKKESQQNPYSIIDGLLAEDKQFQVDKDALKAERDKLDQEIRTFTFQSESHEYKRFQADRETLKAEREKLAQETHSFKLQSESLKQKEEKSEQDKRNLQIEKEGLRKRQSQLQVLEPKNRELEHVKRKLQFEIEESRKRESELQSKVNFLEPRIAELELERSKLQLEIARLGRRNPTESRNGD